MKKILFVDDDSKILKAFSLYFKNKYDFSLATNGNEALEQVKKHAFDLIVSDYGMVEGDGLDFKSSLNNHIEFKDIPFIVVSGQIDKQASIKFANLKVDYILEKPLDFYDLEMKINEIVTIYDKQKEEKRLSFLGKNTGHIIHDINNSLGIILMTSDVGLSLKEKSEKLDKMFNRSKKACNNIVSIIKTYKQIANEKDIVFKEMSSEYLKNILFEESESYSEGSSESVSINLDFSKMNSNNIISIDPVLLKQVILNLWANSKDSFVEQKIKGQIDVVLESTENHLMILIKDNGKGMGEDIKSKVFQEKNSSKGVNGTGMGLSYCKFIMEMHFGKIELIKSDHQGTDFLITLPLVKE